MQKRPKSKSLLDDGVMHLVHRVSQRAEEIFAKEIGDGELTARQLAVLQAVAEIDDPSQTDLVESTGVDRSTLGDLVKRLVSKGLLQRRRSRADARTYIVRLSDQGRAALKSAQPKAARADGALLIRLSSEQRKALIEALKMIVNGAVNFLRSGEVNFPSRLGAVISRSVDRRSYLSMPGYDASEALARAGLR